MAEDAARLAALLGDDSDEDEEIATIAASTAANTSTSETAAARASALLLDDDDDEDDETLVGQMMVGQPAPSKALLGLDDAAGQRRTVLSDGMPNVLGDEQEQDAEEVREVVREEEEQEEEAAPPLNAHTAADDGPIIKKRPLLDLDEEEQEEEAPPILAHTGGTSDTSNTSVEPIKKSLALLDLGEEEEEQEQEKAEEGEAPSLNAHTGAAAGPIKNTSAVLDFGEEKDRDEEQGQEGLKEKGGEEEEEEAPPMNAHTGDASGPIRKSSVALLDLGEEEQEQEEEEEKAPGPLGDADLEEKEEAASYLGAHISDGGTSKKSSGALLDGLDDLEEEDGDVDESAGERITLSAADIVPSKKSSGALLDLGGEEEEEQETAPYLDADLKEEEEEETAGQQRAVSDETALLDFGGEALEEEQGLGEEAPLDAHADETSFAFDDGPIIKKNVALLDLGEAEEEAAAPLNARTDDDDTIAAFDNTGPPSKKSSVALLLDLGEEEQEQEEEAPLFGHPGDTSAADGPSKTALLDSGGGEEQEEEEATMNAHTDDGTSADDGAPKKKKNVALLDLDAEEQEQEQEAAYTDGTSANDGPPKNIPGALLGGEREQEGEAQPTAAPSRKSSGPLLEEEEEEEEEQEEEESQPTATPPSKKSPLLDLGAEQEEEAQPTALSKKLLDLGEEAARVNDLYSHLEMEEEEEETGSTTVDDEGEKEQQSTIDFLGFDTATPKRSRNPFEDDDEEEDDEPLLPFEIPVSLKVSPLILFNLAVDSRRWCRALSYEASWSAIAELSATVLMAAGLVGEEQAPGTGPNDELPLLTFKSLKKSGKTLLLASGATAEKTRVIIAALTEDEEDEVMARALGSLESVLSEAGFFKKHGGAAAEVDRVFLADLERAFAFELAENLRRYARPLEQLARAEELRTAQVMAMVLPSYAASGVPVPRPTRSKPLSAFPLDHPRSRPIIGSFPEGAQKAAADLAMRLHGDTIVAAREELSRWSAEEAAACTRRYASFVTARLANVDAHSGRLLATLTLVLASRPSGGSQKKMRDLFRVAQKDALFYETGALVSGRLGRLYVTSTACYWHSPGLLGGLQHVTPYYTLHGVQVAPLTSSNKGGIGDLLRNVADQCVDAALGLADERVTRLSLLGKDGPLVDLVVLPSPTIPNHAERLADLIRLAMRTDEIMRSSRQHDNKTTGSNASFAEEDNELNVLERLQRIASISQRNAQLLKMGYAPASRSSSVKPKEEESNTAPLPKKAPSTSNLSAFLASVQKTPPASSR